jgi:hypothetical protein
MARPAASRVGGRRFGSPLGAGSVLAGLSARGWQRRAGRALTGGQHGRVGKDLVMAPCQGAGGPSARRRRRDRRRRRTAPRRRTVVACVWALGRWPGARDTTDAQGCASSTVLGDGGHTRCDGGRRRRRTSARRGGGGRRRRAHKARAVVSVVDDGGCKRRAPCRRRAANTGRCPGWTCVRGEPPCASHAPWCARSVWGEPPCVSYPPW